MLGHQVETIHLGRASLRLAGESRDLEDCWLRIDRRAGTLSIFSGGMHAAPVAVLPLRGLELDVCRGAPPPG